MQAATAGQGPDGIGFTCAEVVTMDACPQVEGMGFCGCSCPDASAEVEWPIVRLYDGTFTSFISLYSDTEINNEINNETNNCCIKNRYCSGNETFLNTSDEWCSSFSKIVNRENIPLSLIVNPNETIISNDANEEVLKETCCEILGTIRGQISVPLCGEGQISCADGTCSDAIENCPCPTETEACDIDCMEGENSTEYDALIACLSSTEPMTNLIEGNENIVMVDSDNERCQSVRDELAAALEISPSQLETECFQDKSSIPYQFKVNYTIIPTKEIPFTVADLKLKIDKGIVLPSVGSITKILLRDISGETKELNEELIQEMKSAVKALEEATKKAERAREMEEMEEIRKAEEYKKEYGVGQGIQVTIIGGIFLILFTLIIVSALK